MMKVYTRLMMNGYARYINDLANDKIINIRGILMLSLVMKGFARYIDMLANDETKYEVH